MVSTTIHEVIARIEREDDSDIEEIPRPDLEIPPPTHQPNQNDQVSPIEDGDSDVEEIPRPDLQPQQHVWNPPPMLINTTPWRRYIAFILLALIDIAFNAAAGSAAATVGARMNRKPLTTQVLRVGALAGVTKAGITSFRELVLLSPVNIVLRVLLLLMFSSFGICLVIAAEVGNSVWGEAPKEILIAAVVAAIPLIFESVRDLEPKPDDDGKIDYLTRPIISIFLLASNPLGGYVFARMARNQGMYISSYSAACSAGAVYAILTFLSRVITACITCIQTTSHNKTHNVFGTYEWYQPEPVVITEEEYRHMNAMVGRTVERGFKRAGRLAKGSEKVRGWGLRFLATLVGCACCIERGERKGIQESLREKAGTQAEMTVRMEEFIGEMRRDVGGGLPALTA